MKTNSNTNKGFTLVELLVVVIIIGVLLGVGIVAVTRLIDNAKKEQVKRQEQILVMAAQNYLQENRVFLPKSIGETTTIPVDVLKNNKYITEDIKNSRNETCMVNSFVTASKKSSKKYTYKAYIYCGGDEVVSNTAATTPTVSIDFVDPTGKSIKDDSSILQKVAEAKYIIDFDGGINGDKKVAIDGYSYSVLIQKTGEANPTEVYSSGTLSASGAYTIHVDRDNNLSDYIDVTTANKVIIKATVRNVEGGISDGVEFLGQSDQEASATYKDDVDPVCGRIIGQASANDWITRTTTTTERKISVMCSDGSGSGCIRSTFTKTWSGNVEAGTSTIRIKDNAGNTKDCPVTVNIDRKYPVIKLDAYTRGRSDNTIVGESVIGGSRTTNANGIGLIQDTEYANLQDGYMSKAYYPYGVIYKVTLTDLALNNWKWEVNENEISSTSDSKYEQVSVSNAEGKSGSCSNQSGCEIYINFIENGLRKGVLTVTDKHNNQSTFTIYARVNRSAPGAPIIVNSSNNKSNGDWTKYNVTLTLASNLEQSKIGDYYYSYNENANPMDRNGTTDADADTKWVKLAGGTGQKAFTTYPWTDEMNRQVYIMVCDTSGNCSDSNETSIKIDKHAPTGLVVRGYAKNNGDNIDSPAGLSDTVDSGSWHKGWILVVPSGATDVGSGEVHYKMIVEGASENVVDYTEQNYRNINAQGWSKVTYKVCDAANNCSGTIAYEINLDRTAPTTPEINKTPVDEWTTSNVTLTIKNSEDSGSGIGKYYYTYASSPSGNGSDALHNWVEVTEARNQSSFTKTWTDELNKNVKIKVCDNVNNCNTDASMFVGIDRTPPAQPTINNINGTAYTAAWTNEDFKLVVVSNDGSGSGLAECQYTYASSPSEVGDDASTQWKHNNGTFNSSKTSFTTTDFSLQRDQNVYLRVCDKVGNCSTKSSARIRIDKTAPTCGSSELTQDNSVDGVSGKVNCSDAFGECVSDKFTFTGFKEDASVSIEDKAGNTNSCPVSIVSYDCSDGPWSMPTLKKANNNLCGLDITPSEADLYVFTSGSCLVADNFHTDVCSKKCATKCDIYSTSCDRVCCIRRDRKTCYTTAENYSG